jgi:predicted enzyme related to lactoylglutathione lyase
MWRRAVMELVQSRVVTDDVAGMASFYARLVGTTVVLNDYYVEVPTGALSVGFSKCRFTECSGAGDAQVRDVPSGDVILDFRVDDVDVEFARIDRLGVEWVLEPTTQPWGNRSMVFRDPEGNLVNVYSRTEGAQP